MAQKFTGDSPCPSSPSLTHCPRLGGRGWAGAEAGHLGPEPFWVIVVGSLRPSTEPGAQVAPAQPGGDESRGGTMSSAHRPEGGTLGRGCAQGSSGGPQSCPPWCGGPTGVGIEAKAHS